MWNAITVPTVWYINCSRQCGMFLRFQQCGILTVPCSLECFAVPTVWNFNYTDSVVFELSR
jgi:hypothetical protein